MNNILADVLVKLGDHISTDDIASSKYVTERTPEALAKICLRDVDPEFPLKMAAGGIVVAGINFGCGSGRETAPIALKGAGALAVVAEEFARIFYRNAFNLGLPCIECPGIHAMVNIGDRLELDLAGGRVINQTQGIGVESKPISDILLKQIEAGGLIPILKAKLSMRK
ncbi:MAG: 3-isopropylmalate dehydratase [Syntrophorhabdaceae bacterium]|nr:3-isopropylmalate dehydratase [Syntrophorhabdaceae bacterium]